MRKYQALRNNHSAMCAGLQQTHKGMSGWNIWSRNLLVLGRRGLGTCHLPASWTATMVPEALGHAISQ